MPVLHVCEVLIDLQVISSRDNVWSIFCTLKQHKKDGKMISAELHLYETGMLGKMSTMSSAFTKLMYLTN